MKQTIGKRLLALVLCVYVLLGAAPMALAHESKDAGDGGAGMVQGQIAPISDAYLSYLSGNGGGRIPSSLDLSYLNESYQNLMRRRNGIMPAGYDLRDYGLVPPVTDQGIYGTCWTFGTLDAAASAMMEQFPTVSFSKWHLAWFSYVGQEEEEGTWLNTRDSDVYDPFNFGGGDQMATATMAAWKGPVYEQTLPYGSATVDESLRYDADYHLQDVYVLPYGKYEVLASEMQPTATIPVIKQLMMEKGALSISYCHDSSYYNEETASHYADTFHFSNHEVLLVGWDDNYPRENFRVECRPENDGAWLVRNSWGTDWGDAGYFWLSYEDKSIEYGSYYQLEENDNYAHNYQYDTLGWSVSVAADEFINPDKATMAGYLSNIFTAESDEQLEAVSFYTTDAGTEYEISVWAGVSEDDPTSGRLVYSGQSGRELYAGYHTVELDRAVRLQAGERFSVVVYLKNNTYPYPIAAECCFMPYSQSAPQATGSGGESYYSLDGEHWSDVINLEYQFSDVHATITNVCLKAFTNPLPDDGEASANVRFSLLQGPIALGSELALSGAEEICYQIDGGEITRYTAPIVLERACTVTAWSVTNGKKGNAVTRSYTQVRSTLTELMIRQGGSTLNCDLSDGTDNYTLYVNRQTDRINVLARGCDTITVNGVEVASDSWSDDIPIADGGQTVVEIVSSAAGKQSHVYTLTVCRSALNFDFQAQTVHYDSSLYGLQDADGNPVANGASVSAYCGTALYLTDLSGNVLQKEMVPARGLAIGSPIDFVNERTLYTYGTWNEIADNPEMVGAVSWHGGSIPVQPGQTIYIRRKATDTAFASLPVQLNIPSARPDAPDAAVADISPIHVAMQQIEGAEYRIAPDGEWQTDPVFTDLEADTDYTVEVRIAPTDADFASLPVSVPIHTLSGATLPISYLYGSEEVFCGSVALTEGVNIIAANTEQLAEYGFALQNPAQPTVTVTLTRQGEKWVADAQQVTFFIQPTVDPTAFFYEVVYWDADGNRLPCGGKQYFDRVGSLSRDSIPLPYGYQAVLPEDPEDEDWLYPTGIYYIDGTWNVIPKKVHMIVEKMACVQITFRTQDGDALTDADYALYYGEEGTEQLRVALPDGYEAVGAGAFTVQITRDAGNQLVADPAEICVTVKKTIETKPQTPADPPKQQPSDSTDKTAAPPAPAPSADGTGDPGNLTLWVVLALWSGAALTATAVWRKKKKV